MQKTSGSKVNLPSLEQPAGIVAFQVGEPATNSASQNLNGYSNNSDEYGIVPLRELETSRNLNNQTTVNSVKLFKN